MSALGMRGARGRHSCRPRPPDRPGLPASLPTSPVTSQSSLIRGQLEHHARPATESASHEEATRPADRGWPLAPSSHLGDRERKRRFRCLRNQLIECFLFFLTRYWWRPVLAKAPAVQFSFSSYLSFLVWFLFKMDFGNTRITKTKWSPIHSITRRNSSWFEKIQAPKSHTMLANSSSFLNVGGTLTSTIMSNQERKKNYYQVD